MALLSAEEERVVNERHRKNIPNFYEWAKSHEYNLLVSYPRSGRNWLNAIVEKVTRLKTGDYRDIEGDYEDYILFSIHNDGAEIPSRTVKNAEEGRAKVIVLIRDPRDACWSHYFSYYEEDELPEKQRKSEMIRLARYTVKSWGAIQRIYTPISRLIVRYEDLCSTPVFVMGEVFEEIGSSLGSIETIGTRILEDAIIEEDRKRFGHALLDCHHRAIRQRHKWSNDKFFKEECVPLIQDGLSKEMKEYLYHRVGRS